jgi:hypothetical protein
VHMRACVCVGLRVDGCVGLVHRVISTISKSGRIEAKCAGEPGCLPNALGDLI